MSALLGCKSTDSIPSDILSIQEMKPIIRELMIAEANLGQKPFKQDSINILLKIAYNQISIKNNINSKKLYKSLDYYGKHPADFSKVLDIIADSLTEKVSEIQGLSKPKGEVIKN